MTQDFITKVEHSFETLSGGNGYKFGVFDALVKESLENEPEVLDTVYKILDLLNSSTPEQADILLSMDTAEVIKIANEKIV
jgi:hypothetical protein